MMCQKSQFTLPMKTQVLGYHDPDKQSYQTMLPLQLPATVQGCKQLSWEEALLCILPGDPLPLSSGPTVIVLRSSK